MPRWTPGRTSSAASAALCMITVLDSETADAIGTERIAYGQRVTVIAFGCDPVWRTEEGIVVAGPRAFGYEFDYLPVEELAGATA